MTEMELEVEVWRDRAARGAPETKSDGRSGHHPLSFRPQIKGGQAWLRLGYLRLQLIFAAGLCTPNPIGAFLPVL